MGIEILMIQNTTEQAMEWIQEQNRPRLAHSLHLALSMEMSSFSSISESLIPDSGLIQAPLAAGFQFNTIGRTHRQKVGR